MRTDNAYYTTNTGIILIYLLDQKMSEVKLHYKGENINITLSPSYKLVNMTILLELFCQIIPQKSSNVLGLKGPINH